MIRVTYSELTRIGPYALVQHSQSKQLFVAWYKELAREIWTSGMSGFSA